MQIDDPVQARKKYNKKHVNTYINWFNNEGELENNVYDTWKVL